MRQVKQGIYLNNNIVLKFHLHFLAFNYKTNFILRKFVLFCSYMALVIGELKSSYNVFATFIFILLI